MAGKAKYGAFNTCIRLVPSMSLKSDEATCKTFFFFFLQNFVV